MSQTVISDPTVPEISDVSKVPAFIPGKAPADHLSLFSAAYWRCAAEEFHNVRMLVFAGIICALAIVLKSMPIFLTGMSLRITFTFLAVSLGAYCYGPLMGIAVGACIDTLSTLLFSFGEPYFPGYLLTAMISGLLYGLLLYRRTPSIPRLILLRVLINYGVNVLLGSLWKSMLYGKGYLYYAGTGLIKNTLLLPLEVFLTWILLRFAIKRGILQQFRPDSPRMKTR